MRHGSQARRMRGRSHHTHGQNQPRKGLQNKNRVFDSNGPDVRIRGTAFQIVEKYATLAKDASSTGDWVLAESYLQHAEHYQRMIGTWTEEEANDPQYSESDEPVYDRFAAATPVPQLATTQEPRRDASDQDDLALPASILGARKSEMADA